MDKERMECSVSLIAAYVDVLEDVVPLNHAATRAKMSTVLLNAIRNELEDLTNELTAVRPE